MRFAYPLDLNLTLSPKLCLLVIILNVHTLTNNRSDINTVRYVAICITVLITDYIKKPFYI